MIMQSNKKTSYGPVLNITMKNVHILLIDDGAPLRIHRNVDKGLAEEFGITQKHTLSQGLETLQKLSFDAILLSLSLPDVSLTESVTKTIKIAKEVPVIALVNEGDAPKAAEAVRLGLRDYVFKECHCDSLARTIHYAMERKQLIAEEHARRQETKNEAERISHLSHEWRNSLACIHQFGNILIDGLAGELSSEQREFLGIMLENATKIRTALDSCARVKSASA
jgi:DNA-binding NtrC family response regulator